MSIIKSPKSKLIIEKIICFHENKQQDGEQSECEASRPRCIKKVKVPVINFLLFFSLSYDDPGTHLDAPNAVLKCRFCGCMGGGAL